MVARGLSKSPLESNRIRKSLATEALPTLFFLSLLDLAVSVIPQQRHDTAGSSILRYFSSARIVALTPIGNVIWGSVCPKSMFIMIGNS